MHSTPAPNDALMRQFLAWVSCQPRTYCEVMDAWRTSCPRLSVWEDALGEGLVRVEHGTTMKQSAVTLTPRGEAMLDPSK